MDDVCGKVEKVRESASRVGRKRIQYAINCIFYEANDGYINQSDALLRSVGDYALATLAAPVFAFNVSFIRLMLFKFGSPSTILNAISLVALSTS